MTAREIKRLLQLADEDTVFEYEERAAIIEYCGGKSRIAAESTAGDMVLGDKQKRYFSFPKR